MPDFSTSQGAARITRAALRLDPDRTVHASMYDKSSESTIELVRYDRQGRWYVEAFATEDGHRFLRDRVKTVHEAVEQALGFEPKGGEIHLDRPGGGHFDYAVRAAKQKESRRAQR